MSGMTRRFAWFTASLTSTVGFLVGMVVTGSMSPAPAVSAPPLAPAAAVGAPAVAVPPVMAGLVDFADIADRANRAVVNIDASSRSRRRPPLPSRRGPAEREEFRNPREGGRRAATGTGFFIDPEGYLFTNQHVIEGAERVSVKLADGRSFLARVVGADPDTDIALLKVDAGTPLPYVTLGNSDVLRVGEWVCAIGNPLAYERTVTVGVVSFIGRKLFDQSLDQYIQTDAAISFGNSGGPLLNTRGEVIGINSAVSRQATNIGFAVPINQASAILPQLRANGRVSRGYMGVALRDVDPDLQQSLRLGRADGALVQDVTPGAPGDRAGLRPYDLITAVDGRAVASDDQLIRDIAARTPGTVAHIDFVRDGRPQAVTVKLAERPTRPAVGADAATGRPEKSLQELGGNAVGLSLIQVDETNAHRFDVGAVSTGLLVQRVEPLSPAADAGIERGEVILQVNRRPVASVAAFRRLVDEARPGEPIALYLYNPDLDQRAIKTVRMDAR